MYSVDTETTCKLYFAVDDIRRNCKYQFTEEAAHVTEASTTLQHTARTIGSLGSI